MSPSTSERETRYEIAAPNVIHRVIDGEVVIIDLNTGNYFTLLHSATDIWGCVERRMSVEETVDAIRAGYLGDDSEIEAAVRSTLATLASDGLIVESNGDASVSEGATRRDAERRPFPRPVVEKYDDMQDLILLDPVHEVDATEGWPKKTSDG